MGKEQKNFILAFSGAYQGLELTSWRLAHSSGAFSHASWILHPGSWPCPLTLCSMPSQIRNPKFEIRNRFLSSVVCPLFTPWNSPWANISLGPYAPCLPKFEIILCLSFERWAISLELFLSSVLCPPSSVLCPLTSDLRPLTSDLCPFTLCSMLYALCLVWQTMAQL